MHVNFALIKPFMASIMFKDENLKKRSTARNILSPVQCSLHVLTDGILLRVNFNSQANHGTNKLRIRSKPYVILGIWLRVIVLN